MNHQPVTNAAVILMFSFLSACTGSATKTDQETEKDSVAKARPFDMMGRLAEAASPGPNGGGPVVPLTINFGIEARELKCTAGAGICKVITPVSGSVDSVQVVAGSVVMRVDRSVLEGDAPLSDSFRKYNMNGVISFETPFGFTQQISRQLGVSVIAITSGSPMVFAPDASAPEKLAIIAVGAIPGNSACVSFDNCTGSPYHLSLALSAAVHGCPDSAYTSFYDQGNGFGSLVMYMRTEAVRANPGIADCMPLPDPGNYAPTGWQTFQLASDIVIDEAAAASMSIPGNSVISASQNNAAKLGFYPSGWCVLELTVTLQGSNGVKQKK